MAETVFKVVKDLEREDLFRSLSSEAKVALKHLVSFIESGVYSDSDIEKYIARNFRLSAQKLTEDYNSRHLGSPKKPETFRSQISRMSLSLSSILGIKSSELNEAFVNGNEVLFQRIEALIHAFSVESIDVAERFSLLQGYLPTEISDTKYAIEDCQEELKILRTFDKLMIDRLLSGVNKDKLAFLISELSKPLYTRERSAGEKSTVISIINEEKLALADQFALTKGVRLKTPERIVVQQEKPDSNEEVVESSVVDTPINVSEEDSKPEVIFYGLNITKEMLEAIEFRVQQKITVEEINESIDIGEVFSEYRMFFHSLTVTYPLSDLVAWLKKANNSYLKIVWSEIKEGK